MNQRNVTTKHSNSLVNELKRLLSITLAFVMCLSVVPGIATPVFADSSDPIIKNIEAHPADASVNAEYTPTHLVNGDFEQHPALYPNDVARIWEIKNGEPKGQYYINPEEWGIITNLTTFINNNANNSSTDEIYPIEENWKTTETSYIWGSGVKNSYFEWINLKWKNGTHVPQSYGIPVETCHGNFIEMNANHEAVLYQDLQTNPNDVILWTLSHGVRKGNNSIPATQSIEVEIGKPVNTPSGTDAGLESGSARYTSTSITGTGAFGKQDELVNLSKTKNDTDVWGDAKAVYSVPAGQTLTRFAFISIAGGSLGNMLDNLHFETLLGNVKIDPDTDPDNVVITGYWSPIAKDYLPGVNIEFSVTKENGTVEIVKGSIDMSNVEASGVPHFIAKIPRTNLDPEDYTIKVNPKDFDGAIVTKTFTVDPEVTYFGNGGSKADHNDEVFEFSTFGADYSVKNIDNSAIGFTRPGYTFTGWNTKADGTGTPYAAGETITQLKSNLQLYAQWKANVHTVTWHNKEYTQATSTDLAYGTVVSVGSGDDHSFTAPKDTHGNNYHFVGWADVDSADPVVIYSPTAQFDMPDKDVDLYAVWAAPNTYEVIYHKVSDEAYLTVAEQSPDLIGLVNGASWTVAQGSVFTNPKHKFVGWYDSASYTGSTFTVGTTNTIANASVNLYAKWQELYKVTYHDNGTHDQIYVDDNNGSYYETSASAETLTKTGFTKQDYVFLGWNTAADGSGNTYAPGSSIALTTDVDLYAIWTPVYGISYDLNGGEGTVPSNVAGLKDGDTATIAGNTGFHRDGYEFAGWWAEYPDGTGHNYPVGSIFTVNTTLPHFTVPGEYAILYAQWNPIKHHLTYDLNGGTSPSAIVDSTDYTIPDGNNNATITAIVPERNDYRFLGWALDSDNGSSDLKGGDSLTLFGDTTLYAVWAPLHGVSYSDNCPLGEPHVGHVHSSTNGTGHIPPQIGTAGETVKVTSDEFTFDGFIFKGWNTKADGSGTSYAADDDITIVAGGTVLHAQWELDTFNVFYDLNGGSGSAPIDSHDYAVVTNDNNVEITSVIPTRTDYRFIGWSIDKDNESSVFSAGNYITLDKTTTFYAIWTPLHGISYSDNCPLGEPHVGHVHTTTDGNGHIAPYIGTVGEKTSVSAVEFVFDDFIFTGWNTNADGTGTSYKAGDDIEIPTDGLILHAQWKRLKYTMHYGDGREYDNLWGFNYYEGGTDADGSIIPAGDGYYHPENRDLLPTEVKHITNTDASKYPGVLETGWYFLTWARYEAVSASAIKNTSDTAFKNDSGKYIAYSETEKNKLDDDTTVYKEYLEVKTPDADCGDIDYYAHWVLIAVDVNVHIDINIIKDLDITGFSGLDKDGFDISKGHHLVDVPETEKAELIKNINVMEDFRGNGTEITVTAYVKEHKSDAEYAKISNLITATYGAGITDRIDYDVVVDKIIEYPTTTGTTQEAIDLKELVSPIKVSFAIPDSWQSGGTVHLFRGHTAIGGNVTAIELPDIDADPTTYTVSSNEFSTYTLIYIASAPTPDDSGAEYLLKYETNGGSAIASEWYEEGSTVSLTKIPTREMHIFTGWFLDAALTQPVTSVVMNSTKTVYAGWQLTSVPSMLNRDDHFAYIVGVGDNKVNPNALITRAEVATMFFRLLKDEIRDGNLTQENTFTDVNEGIWYNAPVSTMQKLGIVDGVGNNLFDPEKPMTRAEFAALCVKFDESKNGVVSKFSDIAGHWAEVAIGHAVYLGWVDGRPDGTFAPNDLITRAEAMTLVNRVLQRRPETVDDLLPGMVTWVDNMDTNAWYYLNVQEASNSHHYVDKGEGYEKWTEMVKPRDWAGDYEK